jgi:hypothetical protein
MTFYHRDKLDGHFDTMSADEEIKIHAEFQIEQPGKMMPGYAAHNVETAVGPLSFEVAVGDPAHAADLFAAQIYLVSMYPA